MIDFPIRELCEQIDSSLMVEGTASRLESCGLGVSGWGFGFGV